MDFERLTSIIPTGPNPRQISQLGGSRVTSLFCGLMPELLAKYISVYRNDIIQWDDRSILHDQSPLRNGDVPHPASDGHVRATGLPVVRDEIFDGHFRAVRQMGDERGKAAVQFFGLLHVQFAFPDCQPGSFPYRRLVARQRRKRRELCGSVKHRHLRMVPRNVVRRNLPPN